MKNDIHVFHDLNNDGFSEEIWIQAWIPGRSNIVIKEKGLIIDQWNFRGEFLPGPVCFFSDYNHDGSKEVFVFTFVNDSIFLHRIASFSRSPGILFTTYVDSYQERDNGFAAEANELEFADHDDDGIKEFVFAISTGYARFPRRIYTYNIEEDSLTRSFEMGSPILFPIAFDLDEDGENEFVFQSSAFGNTSEDYPFTDHRAWLMVIDRNLKPVFDPIPFGEYKTILQVVPFSSGNSAYLVVFQKHVGTEDIGNMLFTYDLSGTRLHERNLGALSEVEYSWLLSADQATRDKLFLIHGDGRVEQLNLELETINEIMVNGIVDGKPVRIIDLDQDGYEEYIFMGKDRQSHIITSHDFKYRVEIDTPNDIHIEYSISLIEKGNEAPMVHFPLGAFTYVFRYAHNPVFKYRIVIYLCIAASIFFLLYIIWKLRQSHRFQAEKKIASLQLKSIKNQVDPHFTLNIMNAIGTLFVQRDEEQANYLFGKYAKMLKNTILSAESISVTLSEEIEYVSNYLDLERFRLNNRFDFSIDLGTAVDMNYQVPKMLIYTFVENAIKHGIRHMDRPGMLKVNIEKQKKLYEISITDNGIGRTAAARLSTGGTGAGLKIIDQIINLYYKLEGIRISYSVIDLYDHADQPSGTKIMIFVPV